SVAAAGGDGQFVFAWNNGENDPDLDNLPAGNYVLTVTDGEGCSAVLQVSVQQPENLQSNALATPVSAPGNTDGTGTANPSGGVAPYQFLWSTGENSQTITGLAEGFYVVTVTDANNCTAEETLEVTDIDCNLSGSVNTAEPACFGEANGSASAIAAGGVGTLTYAWSNGASTQTIGGLAAGQYAVTVSDENGCNWSVSLTLAEPPALTLELVGVVNTICPNDATGALSAAAAGGSGNILISWSNGQEGPALSGLVAGIYAATATDANGCTRDLTVEMESNDQDPPHIPGGVAQLPLGVAGVITLTVQNMGLTISDNCAVRTVEFVPKNFDCQK
ncbi:MAG: SprB repeat-containing protein, partial [Saprospiraceae bacterium]